MKSTDYEPGGRIDRDDERNEASSGRRGPSVALIGLLLVAAYAVAFFFRNSQETQVDFVFGETDTTLRWSLLLAVGLGVVLALLIGTWWRRRHR